MNQPKKDIEILTVLRTPRIADVALFDLVGAVLGTEIVFRWMGMPKYLGAISSIPIGMITHRVIGVKTKI